MTDMTVDPRSGNGMVDVSVYGAETWSRGAASSSNEDNV